MTFRHVFIAGALLALFAGCSGDTAKKPTSPPDEVVTDVDGDGLEGKDDCDDEDARVGGPATWYEDADGDGIGGDATAEACEAPRGHVDTTGDCDDDDDDVFPGNTEVPYDGLDNDCEDGDLIDVDGDGFSYLDDCDDEDASVVVLGNFWIDCDGDGVHDPTQVQACGDPLTACGGRAPAAYTTANPGSFDCNDADATASVAQNWYPDCDGDGDAHATPVNACGTLGADAMFDCLDSGNPDGGWLTVAGQDCDDEDSGSVGLFVWFADCDGDGEADSSNTVSTCDQNVAANTNSCGAQPPVAVTRDSAAANDCDDTDSTEFPGQAWYPDCDADTVYAGTAVVACALADADAASPCTSGTPDSWTHTAPGSADCDDEDADEFPGQIWYPDCDGDTAFDIDNPVTACDTSAADAQNVCAGAAPTGGWTHDGGVADDCNDDPNDSNAANEFPGQQWYPDCDADGAFDADNAAVGCDVTEATADNVCLDNAAPDGGFTLTDPAASDDCNDFDALSFPGQVWYPDCDGDTYFDADNVVVACARADADAASPCDGGAPVRWTHADPGGQTDCDDENAAVLPGLVFYPDCDGDGFFSQLNTATACDAAAADQQDVCAGYTGTPTGGWTQTDPAANADCNDIDTDPEAADAFPGQQWYPDCDGDTFFSDTAVTACDAGGATAASPCGLPTGGWQNTTPNPADCDDGDGNKRPDQTWYPDCDNDGWYDGSNGVMACDTADADSRNACAGGAPSGGWTSTDPNTNSDCADEDAVSYPGQTWYPDCDGDTYYDQDNPVTACDTTEADAASACVAGAAVGWSTTVAADDCNDEDAGAIPGLMWYPDCDGDGYYDADSAVAACDQASANAASVCVAAPAAPPGGWSNTDPAGNDDCNDDDSDGSAVNEFPGQSWYPDCDGDSYYDADNAITACQRADAMAQTACAGSPPGSVALSGFTDDCDDNPTDGADAYPGKATFDPEDVGDGQDNDCDGNHECFVDTDNDGVGGIAALIQDTDADGQCDDVGDSESLEALDCDETDPASLYCEDCLHILEADPTAADGDWFIVGDGSVPPFRVTCDMSGGGWTALTVVPNNDRLWMAESSATSDCAGGGGNPWCKCDDDSAQYYSGIGEAAVASDGNGTYDVDYASGGSTLNVAQVDALRAVIGEMMPGNRLVAVVSDDEGNLQESTTASGHEAYAVDAGGNTLLLTPGENGDCGAGSGNWPVAGSASGYWLWHADPNEAATAGQFVVAPGSTQLPAAFLLPAQIILDSRSGGGVSVGWEQDTLRVRRGPASCAAILADNAAAADDLYYVDTPEGPALTWCDMTTTSAAVSCNDLWMVDNTLPDGVYAIDPDGLGLFAAWCDMTTVSAGGQSGWTLLGTIHGGDSDNWSIDGTTHWGDLRLLGAVGTPFATDYKGDAWNRLDLSGAHILYERHYNGAIRAQAQIDNACLTDGGSGSVATAFVDLFADPVNDFNTPCDATNITMLMPANSGLAADQAGIRGTYREGVDASGLTGSSTNGWCWNGGDTGGNIFSGHLGYNQSGSACYDGGHLSYIGVWDEQHAQYSGVDIDRTNFMNDTTNVDTTLVSFSMWAL